MPFLRPRRGLIAILIGASASLAACRPATPDNAAVPANADEPALNLPSVPLPDPPLDRAGLLAAVAEAASAEASGADDSEAQRALDGRQFEMRIRFGCRGPTQDFEQAALGWAYDAERRRLRVRARPTISAEEPLVAAIGPGESEAVEGFWIPRPWLLQPACPQAAAVKAAPVGEQAEALEADAADVEPQPVTRGRRVGIAQFFSETDPRTGRRDGRPYEAVKTLEEGQPLASQGYVLVLSGRLRALPGMGVIGCSASGPDSPPECIVSADFDRVWIERPPSGEVIAEWRSS